MSVQALGKLLSKLKAGGALSEADIHELTLAQAKLAQFEALSSSKPQPDPVDPLCRLNDVEVVSREGMGTILCAKKDFAVNETILVEKPLLVYASTKQSLDLCNEFAKLDDEMKARIFEFKHADINSEAITRRGGERLKKLAEEVEAVAGLSKEDVFRLRSIDNINEYRYTEPEGKGSVEPLMGLYSIASRAMHSCSSNCLPSSRLLPGYLTMTALEPIAKGDIISVDFTGHAVALSTIARRETLETERDLYCHCTRCMGPEYARGIRCLKDGCQGIKVGIMDCDENADKWLSWKCQTCGDEEDVTRRLLATEANVQLRIDTFVREARKDTVRPPMRDALNIEAGIQELSRTHYLVTRMYIELGRWSNFTVKVWSSAGNFSKQGVQEHASTAGASRIKAVQNIECVSSNCVVGDVPCVNIHAPVAGCLQPVVDAFKDLQLAFPLELGKEEVFFQRYMPLLTAAKGADDESRRAICHALSETWFKACKMGPLAICRWCGGLRKEGGGPLQVCTRCRQVAYCNRHCQAAHWKDSHKTECKKKPAAETEEKS